MSELKLRFPGYTEPLKRISCGEMFQERKEKGQDHLPILTLSIHTGISDHELDDAESIKKVKRSEDKSLYKRVYPNDLAFNMMRAWQGAFGVSKVDGMISPAYIVAEPIKEINAAYLNYYIQTARFIGAANNLSYGVTDFRKRLYWNSFCKIELHLPSLEEQNKIAALLVSIDNTIDKQKEMISAWEERKKGVMQKLFSQEVRFKADDGSKFPDWKEKKIGECTKFVKDGTHGTHKNVNYGHPLLSAKDIFDNVVHIANDTRLISNDDYNKIFSKYSLQIDDVLITIVGTLGRTALVTDACKHVAFQRSVAIMRPDKNIIISNYLKAVCDVSHFQNELETKKNRGAQAGVYLGVLSNMEIPVPCLAEQQKIAECLSALDKVIEKQKARLAAWEELKKCLLQQMFV